MTAGINWRAVVFDPDGKLYIKSDLRLYPLETHANPAWLCIAEYVPGGGIAVKIPKPAYATIELEKGRLSGYLPVSEVF